MMRLQRVGRKNDPSYRVVVVDKRTGPKSNKNIDILGSYNPKMDQVQIDAEKAKQWLSQGVQPSDTVHNILVGQKIIDAKKINVLPQKSPVVKEAPEEKAATEEGGAEEKEESEEKAADSDESVAQPEAKEEEAAKEEKTEESTEAPAEESKEETTESSEEQEEKKDE